MLQSTAPGPVRGQAINDRAGERSGTAEAVFRNLPEEESRDHEGQVAAAGLQAPAWGHQSSERRSNLPKVTKLVNITLALWPGQEPGA